MNDFSVDPNLLDEVLLQLTPVKVVSFKVNILSTDITFRLHSEHVRRLQVRLSRQIHMSVLCRVIVA